MRLTLVRHGETIWNKEKKIQGMSDIGLTELGIEQADKLSIALKEEKFDSIITSPLKRAYDTAQAIGKYHNIEITVENALHELNAGELEGLSYPDLLLKYPDFLRQWLLDHSSVTMPNGESLQDVQDRVWPIIKNILHTYENALVVTHSFVIITILCKIQNLHLSESAKMRLSVASRTSMLVENGSAKMISFNDTAHLQDV